MITCNVAVIYRIYSRMGEGVFIEEKYKILFENSKKMIIYSSHCSFLTVSLLKTEMKAHRLLRTTTALSLYAINAVNNKGILRKVNRPCHILS